MDRLKGVTSFDTSIQWSYTTSLQASVLRQIYRDTNTIRRCVDQIATTIAGLPFEVKVSHPFKKEVISAIFEGVGPTGETFKEVLQACVVDMLVINKGVILPVFTLGSQLKSFTARDAGTFAPVFRKDGVLLGYIQEVNGKKFEFKPDEVIVIAGVKRTYTIGSLSIIESLTYEITNLVYSLQRMHKKGRPPIGVFVVQEDVGKEVIEKLQADLTNLVQEQSTKVPILWGAGRGEWIDIVKQLDVQLITSFLDRMDWLVRSAFGFSNPGDSLGRQTARPLLYSTYTPHIVTAIQDQLNHFLRPYGINIRFKIPPAHTISELLLAARSGLISPNEARAFLHLPPAQGGDTLTILQPQGLTPVGGTKPPGGEAKPPTQEPIVVTPARAESEDPFQEIKRAAELEYLESVRNLNLISDPKTADFVSKRMTLSMKLTKKLRKVHEELTEKLCEKFMLVRADVTPTLDPLDKWFYTQIQNALKDVTPDALQAGYYWVDRYWPSYDKDYVDAETVRSLKKINDYMTRQWTSKYQEVKKDAEKRDWDKVRDDLHKLLLSFLAAGAFVGYLTHLPLQAVTRFFTLKGKTIYYKWVGTGDENMCQDCREMHGKVFSQTELEFIGRWPGCGEPYKARGVRCNGKCRCVLIPVDIEETRFEVDWLQKVIPVRGLHLPKSELLAIGALDHVDKKIRDILLKEPRLREPAYFALFDKITTTAAETPYYNPLENTLYIPAKATHSTVRSAFVDAVVENLMFRNNFLDPYSPITAQLAAIMQKAREDVWETRLWKVFRKVGIELGKEPYIKLEEAWKFGNLAPFEKFTLPLDFPKEAYVDPMLFFKHMFRAVIFTPHREIPGKVAFEDFLASTLWTPSSYKKWVGKSLERLGRPWPAVTSVDAIMKRIPYVDEKIEPYIRSLLETYPFLRVPAIWEGLNYIGFSKTTSTFNASYILGRGYEKFMESFNSSIVATPNLYQILHELGHHIFERHVMYNTLLGSTYGQVYLYGILYPFVERATLYAKSEKEVAKLIGFLEYLVEKEQKGQLQAALLASSSYIRETLIKPLQDRLPEITKNLSIPLRVYAISDPAESFAELFATFVTKPTILRYSSPELYDYFLSLMKAVAVKPLAKLKTEGMWKEFVEAMKKLKLNPDQIREAIEATLTVMASTEAQNWDTVGMMIRRIIAASRSDKGLLLELEKEGVIDVQGFSKQLNKMTEFSRLKALEEARKRPVTAAILKREREKYKRLFEFLADTKGKDFHNVVVEFVARLAPEEQCEPIVNKIFAYLDRQGWSKDAMYNVWRRLKNIQSGGKPRQDAYKWFEEEMKVKWTLKRPWEKKKKVIEAAKREKWFIKFQEAAKGKDFRKLVAKFVTKLTSEEQQVPVANKIFAYLNKHGWSEDAKFNVWRHLRGIVLGGKWREAAFEWFKKEVGIVWVAPKRRPEEQYLLKLLKKEGE